MPNKSTKSAGGDWMSRMPAKGKVIRKLRGKTRTHVEKGMRTVSLFPPRRGPEGEIVGTISVSVLKRFGLNKPAAIFDYIIVRKANGRPAVVLKPVNSAGAPTLESFIKALISIGVIPADKAVTALSVVSAPATEVSVPHQNLSEGNVGESVRTLQKLLNEKGYTVSSTGAGSPGHETSIFGPATAKALKAFQKANGIPATGFFGPLTRAALGQ